MTFPPTAKIWKFSLKCLKCLKFLNFLPSPRPRAQPRPQQASAAGVRPDVTLGHGGDHFSGRAHLAGLPRLRTQLPPRRPHRPARRHHREGRFCSRAYLCNSVATLCNFDSQILIKALQFFAISLQFFAMFSSKAYLRLLISKISTISRNF